MRMGDFYRTLALLTQRGWKPILDGDGKIRIKAPSGKKCCPITAVALSKTRRHYSTDEYEKAAKKINVMRDSVYRIVDASDHPKPTENEGDETTNHPLVRSRLAAALGLTLSVS